MVKCNATFSLEITFVAEWWSSINLRVYGSTEDLKLMSEESWVSVANHFSDIDWLISWVFCERVGILGVSMNTSRKQLRFSYSLLDFLLKSWTVRQVL